MRRCYNKKQGFLGPNDILMNDMFPRAKVFHAEPEKIFMKKGVSIGVNATIICGTTVGEYVMIGAGSVVTKDVPSYALVYDKPARLVSRICSCTNKLVFDDKTECICGYKKKNDHSIIRI